MKIDLIAGTRPNFVKIAALIHANKASHHNIQFRVIHTGQHYNKLLSGSFFKDLELPKPDVNFGIGSGTQAQQTSGIMIKYEELLTISRPDLCLVVGDVTSSMACAITAKKMRIKVGHVEAGIRSFDWSMPEEINRVLIDSITDYFFATSQTAVDLLLKNGHSKDKIFFVGNTMIDTLMKFQSHFKKPNIWDKLNLQEKKYFLLTLHRPGNVDNLEDLETYLKKIIETSKGLPIIFPVHPRTLVVLRDSLLKASNFFPIDPLPYLEFNYLLQKAKAVITDSGGITEEATVLNIPCLTLRDNTERPETVTVGTNELIGTNPDSIPGAMEKIHLDQWKKGKLPELWDGKAGERILTILNTL